MSGRLAGKGAIACGAGSASPGDLSNGMARAVIMAREGAKVFAVDRGQSCSVTGRISEWHGFAS